MKTKTRIKNRSRGKREKSKTGEKHEKKGKAYTIKFEGENKEFI